MPEFETVMMQQCTSNSKMQVSIGGYEQNNLGSEDLWPTCTCPDYQSGKNGYTTFKHTKVSRCCDHINKYYSFACCWHELDTNIPQLVEGICPVCGENTEAVKVAI